jgi:hypothetical protein
MAGNGQAASAADQGPLTSLTPLTSFTPLTERAVGDGPRSGCAQDPATREAT